MGHDAVLHVSPTLRAPAEARRFAVATLREWDHRQALPLVELVLSELVTNAIRHGAPPIDLTLHLDGDRLRVAVSDAARNERPVRRQPERGREGSFGLNLIHAAAKDWGYEVGIDDKTVWADLDLGDPATWSLDSIDFDSDRG